MSAAMTVIFAGGGSGGHISPGLAIAERLRERTSDVKPLFICSTRDIDRQMLEEAGETFVPIPATPPAWQPRAAWQFLRNFQKSRRQVRSLIHEQPVRGVVALGGFVAVPIVAAAKREGVPAVLINLDAPPGKANRMMARKCNAVYSAVALPMLPQFASEVVGMPIRRRAIAREKAAACRTELGLAPDRLTLMVTGASQGATSINRMMIELVHQSPALLADAQVLHLAGSGASESLREAYAEANIRAVVIEFLYEIGRAWGAADIAVSRAGANSVAEAAANRVPTIFLPYPHHRDKHQRHNAQPLVDAGGALMLDDAVDAEVNARLIEPILTVLLRDEVKRRTMQAALEPFARADAADRIAAMILEQLQLS